jgi:hypothetical protein
MDRRSLLNLIGLAPVAPAAAALPAAPSFLWANRWRDHFGGVTEMASRSIPLELEYGELEELRGYEDRLAAVSTEALTGPANAGRPMIPEPPSSVDDDLPYWGA